MTTQQVADRLVELCRQGQIFPAQEELYADDAVSIEPDIAPVKEVRGKKAIYDKGQLFQSMIVEFHGAQISDPLVAGRYFTIKWLMDVTMKDRGRSTMEEICLYEVKEGKIISEQFFF